MPRSCLCLQVPYLAHFKTGGVYSKIPILVVLCFTPQTIEFDEGAGAVLRIQPLRAPRDENIYECVAENSEGEITVNAKLSIIRGESYTVKQCAEL